MPLPLIYDTELSLIVLSFQPPFIQTLEEIQTNADKASPKVDFKSPLKHN